MTKAPSLSHKLDITGEGLRADGHPAVIEIGPNHNDSLARGSRLILR
jgi:hypothetical protein